MPKKFPNIIVAGTPGAWVNHVMVSLERKGWRITWEGQDLSSELSMDYLNRNHQNIVVQQMVNSICDEYGVGLLTENLPEFYETPFPGPKEFLAKFSARSFGAVAISAICIGLFLDIWLSHVDFVVDITASKGDDIAVLNALTQGEYSVEQLESLREYQIKRYRSKLLQFPYVYSMSNDEIKQKDYVGLLNYIDSKS